MPAPAATPTALPPGAVRLHAVEEPREAELEPVVAVSSASIRGSSAARPERSLTAGSGGTLGGDQPALVVAAAGASVWTSWVVNLLVVEWWVLRPPHRAVPAV